jgi:hypothetical protein
MMDVRMRNAGQGYEAPAIGVPGSVAELTQDLFDKRWGGRDGWTFMGVNVPVHNVSP